MKKKLLLLGATGKMGTSLSRTLARHYFVLPKSSRDFDAGDFRETERLIADATPDIIVNAVSFMGIEPCAQDPHKAFRLNTLFPHLLARLANSRRALLVHFSSDAVFDGQKNDFYHEKDSPAPLNLYGATKFAGDAMVMAHAEKHYIFRIPFIFGPPTARGQFAERMLLKAKAGETLRVAGDVYTTPSYALDIAEEVSRLLTNDSPFGLYHLTNHGKASLYEFVVFLLRLAHIPALVKQVSHRDFPSLGIKNTNTLLTSIKLNPLRSWQDAAKDWVETCNIQTP